MRYIFSVCALLLCNFSFSQEIDRKQDLKIIIEKTYTNQNSESFLNLMAAEAILLSEKTLDADLLIQKFKERLMEDEFFAKLALTYEPFSDDEIKELRKIHENVTFEKYSMHSGTIFQTNIQIIKEIFKELALVHGKERTSDPELNMIEITKDNFQKEVMECNEFVIVDVYSNNCPPCRLMQPVIEELSQQYRGIVRFVKLNCETEEEITQQLGISHLPTFLFIKPADKTIFLKISGFLTKKDFQAKIEELVKSE